MDIIWTWTKIIAPTWESSLMVLSLIWFTNCQKKKRWCGTSIPSSLQMMLLFCVTSKWWGREWWGSQCMGQSRQTAFTYLSKISQSQFSSCYYSCVVFISPRNPISLIVLCKFSLPWYLSTYLLASSSLK